MAKKKHHKRHRRVGAAGMGKKSTGLKLLAVAAGYLLADTINTQVDKILPKTTDTTVTPNVTKPNETIGIVGELGLGGLLLMRKKSHGTTGMVMTLAGGVLAGAGIKRALKKAGVISGYQSVPVIGSHLGRKRMTGYQSVPVIGRTPPQLAGRPAQLQGYLSAGSGVGAYTPAGSGVMNGCGSGIMNTGSGYMQ